MMKPPFLACSLALGLLTTASGRAQLSDVSPFLPAGATPGSAAAENNPLEYRGVMPSGKDLLVCIYDAAKKTSRWVGINERVDGAGFLVKSVDLDKDTVAVQSGGQTMTLHMQKGKVLPGGPVVMFGARGNIVIGGGVGAPNLAAQPPPPTPAEEQARLQAVADEVRRRRDARLAADAQADAQAAAQPGQNNGANMPPRGAPGQR